MLSETPLPLLGLLLLAAMLTAQTGGYWLRQRKLRKPGAASSEDETYLVSGVFGLLALLMAFAFSLAIGRYEDRRHLAVEEANAIDTMASRIELIEQPGQADLMRKLAVYAEDRTAAGRRQDAANWSVSAAKAEVSGRALRSAIQDIVRTRPDDSRSMLLTEAMNAMLDTATARHAARAAHLPESVLALLLLYCLAGAATLGYAHARSGDRHLAASALLFALLSAAYVTVLDLDRPRGGAIVVPQQDLEQVTARLQPLS